MSSSDRFGLEAESTGTVEIDVGIIVKDFHLHGVQIFTEVWKINEKTVINDQLLIIFLNYKLINPFNIIIKWPS